MLELVGELFRYQPWADAQIVAAVKAHPPAVEDRQILTWLAKTGQFARLSEIPIDELLPIVLHSQHHRSQVASRLRALGGAPPTVDYILWKRKYA